jgi:hypothetical protein
MSAFARRLQALEAAASRSRDTDTPERRRAVEELQTYLQALFSEHDPDGQMLAAYHAAGDPQGRAVIMVDLVELARGGAMRRFLDLLAAAQGRPAPLT